MFKWRPKWWNKPITWGDSVKCALWSIPVSLVILFIEGLCFGWFDDTIDKMKSGLDSAHSTVSGWTEEAQEKWNDIFHKEES